VRTESPELAVDVDRRTQGCWAKHKQFFVFDNSTNFEGKINRLLVTVSEIVFRTQNLHPEHAIALLHQQNFAKAGNLAKKASS
jgi:hypothetical protein